MSTGIFICKTNTDFNFGWNYIWQRGWPGLAIFSSKYWNSSPVMELYKRLLQSILCFQIVFSQPDVWQWLWAWQEERQFCDFSWLIDRGRPNAKDINIAWSLGVLQLGCFLAPNCFVSLPFGLIFAPLGASSLFPPFAAAVVRGDSQRHSWSNLKITFGSMLIIDSLIIFSLFFGFGDFLTVKVGQDEIFWKVIVWEIWNSDSQYLSPK